MKAWWIGVVIVLHVSPLLSQELSPSSSNEIDSLKELSEVNTSTIPELSNSENSESIPTNPLDTNLEISPSNSGSIEHVETVISHVSGTPTSSTSISMVLTSSAAQGANHASATPFRTPHPSATTSGRITQTILQSGSSSLFVSLLVWLAVSFSIAICLPLV
ncbi:hypothetical protein K7432_007053 [Basidiobolus ranarum]|uniref:Uncharacterized protein n=1 Tax=Basidiobolus ranarum TaxID=34480 RepID=A0ABR2WU85_9FUNG